MFGYFVFCWYFLDYHLGNCRIKDETGAYPDALLCVGLQHLVALKPKDPKDLYKRHGGYLIPEWERSKLDNGESQ